MARRLTLHHPFAPWAAPPEQIARTLIGRLDVLRNVLEKVQAAGQGATPKHCLIIGPRGMGKTHLLSFLHHYVLGDIVRDDLPHPVGKWRSVFFAEETYPQLNTLANFLLALMQQLAEVEPDESRWRVPAAVTRADDPVVVDFCLERIRESFASDGRRLLLLVDNLQKVLQQLPLEDHHRLRAFLNDQQAVMLVGTAPTYFDLVASYGAPFYDYFEPLLLRDLSPDEMLAMLGSRFGEDGRAEEFERRREELKRKIPAICKLTGGNPRLVLFLYDMVTRSALAEVEATLRGLIEQVTDYFRARYDALAPQARKVLVTLASQEGPSTPTEIARAARLSVPTVNAQLQRLRDHVERVKSTRKRETRYDVSERLFRIWRQTASQAGRRRFRLLAELLAIYYTPDEMAARVQTLVAGLPERLESGGKEAILRALEDLYYWQDAARPAGLHYGLFGSRFAEIMRLGEYRRCLGEVDGFLAECVRGHDQVGQTMASSLRAAVLLRSARPEDALSGCEEALAVCRDRDAAVPEFFTQGTLFVKGAALMYLDRYEEALAALNCVVERGDSGVAERTSLVGPALAWKVVALDRLGRVEDVLAVAAELDPVVHGLPDVVAEEVGFTLVDTGVGLAKQGAFDQALLVWRQVQRLFSGREDRMAQESLVVAFSLRATVAAELGLVQEAVGSIQAALAWPESQTKEWFRVSIGVTLRTILLRSPETFPDAVALVEDKAKDPQLRDFLRPFSEAVRYAQTGDPAILDRLFPEVRELVLEIAEKLKRPGTVEPPE